MSISVSRRTSKATKSSGGEGGQPDIEAEAEGSSNQRYYLNREGEEEEDPEVIARAIEEEEQLEAFANTRDSFAILCVMNQYKLSSSLPLSEHTLRKNLLTALFLTDFTSGKFGLTDTRRSVAAEIRRLRRRGVVPILASLGWFFFALAISLYKAFGEVGDNATAHNLALGLLMGWLPVLVSAAIVDRNSLDSEHVAKLLNNLMRRVHPYNVTFTKFVGQGRRRWHYGVAHPILTMLERYPDEIRRPVDWMEVAIKCIEDDGEWVKEDKHRRESESIAYFSKWEFVHMLAAWLTIGLSVLGAWYLSYNTPTVGLGCRSFSYVMFLVVCTFSGLLELLLYPVIYRPVKKKSTGDLVKVDGFRGYISSKKFRSLMNSVLDVIDIISSLVLFTTIFMQTTGAFQLYWCKASLLGHSGGYVLFDNVQFIKKWFDANMYWLVGTVVSSIVPVVGTLWTLREWLTQSFMWSTDTGMARRGLRRVRAWKGFWWGVRLGGRVNLRWIKDGVRWRP
ncbi:hypothetical protein ABW19_dt0207885 [Dactylella cylindrospora]|nr:hypothetical protein ABW19_dt0207885 [Dactylella cylindrospora]